jgi:hypothetical protein
MSRCCPLPMCRMQKRIFKKPIHLVRHLIFRCPDAAASALLAKVPEVARSQSQFPNLRACPTCDHTVVDAGDAGECVLPPPWLFAWHICEGHCSPVYDAVSLNELCMVLAHACIAAASHLSCSVTFFAEESLFHREATAHCSQRMSLVMCEDAQQCRERSRSCSTSVIFVSRPHCLSTSREKNGLFFLCHLLSLMLANHLAQGTIGCTKLMHMDVVTTECDAAASLGKLFEGQLSITYRSPESLAP